MMAGVRNDTGRAIEDAIAAGQVVGILGGVGISSLSPIGDLEKGVIA